MFRLTLAIVVTLPMMAYAQTPADIAHQLWPLNAPTAVAGGEAHGFAPQGGGTGLDLARLIAASPGQGSINSAPLAGSASAGAFAGADVARLVGRNEGAGSSGVKLAVRKQGSASF